MPRQRTFTEALEFSKQHRDWWNEKLRSFFPGCSALEWIDTDKDDDGIDVIVHFDNGHTINVDVKRINQRYWQLGYERADEPVILFEYESSPGRPGWIEKQAHTDYILYGCPEEDEVVQLPFPVLQQTWRACKVDWLERAKHDPGFWYVKGTNPTYQSSCVVVPVSVVFKRMLRSNVRGRTP